MYELAILGEWTFAILKIMLAELSFIFLLERIELSLITIEVTVVGLLSKMPHHFTRWIVEVSWSSLCIVSLALISCFFSIGAIFQWVVWWSVVGCTVSTIVLFTWVVTSLFQVNLLVLLRSLWIWGSFLLNFSILSLLVNVLLLLGLLLLFGLLRSVAHHSSNPFLFFNIYLSSIKKSIKNNILNPSVSFNF